MLVGDVFSFRKDQQMSFFSQEKGCKAEMLEGAENKRHLIHLTSPLGICLPTVAM